MSCLSSNFNHGDYRSPSFPTIVRQDKKDEEGNTVVSFLPLDTQSIIESNGSVDKWSLELLVSSGVNPKDVTPRTSFPTRLESHQVTDQFADQLAAKLDQELADLESEPEPEPVPESDPVNGE